MKQLLLVTILLGSISILHAQKQPSADFINFNPHFESFTLPGGTLGNSVQTIVQDSVGFLWFASQAGLHRYDGKNFITYLYDANNPNTPSSDYIEYIFFDSKGIMWLTHWQQGSLTSFDPDREIFTRYTHDPNDPESLMDGELSEVAEDQMGYIWIGGQKGLNRLDRETGRVKRFPHDPGDSSSLSCNEVRAINVDRQGTVWVGTGLPWNDNDPEEIIGGLNRYDPKTETFVQYRHDPSDPRSLANNKVRAMLEDSQGNFWIGTAGDGLQQMDRATGRFKRFTYDPANPDNLTRPFLRGTSPAALPIFSHVTSIFEDLDGRIWITAVEGGLNVYNPAAGIVKHFEAGPGKDDLKTNFLWQTYQTRDRTIWIASGGEGKAVFKVKERGDLLPFINTNRSLEDSLRYLHGIVKDRDGNVWIAQTDPINLLKVNSQKGKEEKIPFGDPLNPPGFLYGFSFDLEGNLWFGTDKGYFRGNRGTSNFQRFQPAEIPAEILQAGLAPILQSRTGFIWLPGWDVGLTRYDPETGNFINFSHDPNDPKTIGGNRVWGLYEDAEGNLWAGGGSPWNEMDKPLFLDRFIPQTNTFEHFVKGGRQPGMAFFITGDEAGNIWFIDFIDGLFKLNPITGMLKKFTPFNSLLPSSQLLSMVKTKTGKIWLSSERDLIEFDPMTETMSLFNASHGVRTAQGYFGSGSIAADGELFFARKGGFHAFYPEKLFLNDKAHLPDLRITGFRLLDERMTSGSTNNQNGVLNKPIWQTSSIQVAYYQNVFSFAVACFDFYDPSANQIQFMLEGYDRGWRKDVRDGETPSYINVPPGEYTFRLRGVNSFGVWNREGVSLRITILPPWWKTWWAYAFYALCLIAGIFLTDRIQRNRIAQKERSRTRDRELAQAQEIEKAYHALKATQSQLIQSEKMASLGELTAGIAHEIQNPLNFVNNFSEVNIELLNELKEGILRNLPAEESGEADEIVGNISQNLEKISFHGKRADAIVKSMLLHSRSSGGTKDLTNINALADEYLRLSYHGMRARDKSFNVKYHLEMDENLPEIRVIAQDIGRVILNLINNAFYAVSRKSKEGLNGYVPEVWLSTKKLDESAEIRIRDNGDGIPANFMDKIFQPFFTTKPAGEGTGLGLSISYEIITKGHGGELKVKSFTAENHAGPELGTEFIIILPI